MNSLEFLAVKYDTDKSMSGHGYTEIYYDLFKDKKYDAIKLMEIGVWKGASIKMWREFFPNAKIIGCDIMEECVSIEKDDIEFVLMDQNKEEDLLDLAAKGPFDIIIEDGGHLWEQQIKSFEFLWGSIKPYGYYIVEDIQCSYLENYRQGTIRSIDYFKNLVSILHTKTCGHSNLNVPEWRINQFEQTIRQITFFGELVVIQKK